MSLQQQLSKIQALENHREQQREKMNRLLEQKKKIEQDIKSLEIVLEDLDERVEKLEEECLLGQEEQQPQPQLKEAPQQPQQQQVREEPPQNSPNISELSPVNPLSSTQHLSLTHPEEHLTDPLSQYPAPSRRTAGAARVSLDGPPRQNNSPIVDVDVDVEGSSEENHPPPNVAYSSAAAAALPNVTSASAAASRSTFGSVRQLEITKVPPKKKKVKGNGTLDHFLVPASKPAADTVPSHGRANAAGNAETSTSSALCHASTNKYSHSNFPWSGQVKELLQKSFKIKQFRDHQEEVINCTLSGQDVFVLMRTGGGKSLTYQLPALLEGRGRGHSGKVTVVISPLLSLIKDQEVQMNQFAAGSAVSFTSNLSGGQSEHTRRWNLVRDPQQGVCLILVTPEKVYKSNKLKSELQKLHRQGRLGRFVIDEAHCSSNWGHDFRPDYTKLGVLKTLFPDIPVMAVTATASDRVRHDVCDILNISRQCCFFRSSSNRPNLTYSVKTKGSAENVLNSMADFIKENHPGKAGIIYTLSKKDADTVADEMCSRGIVAQSYHSDVTPKQKDMIHQSWMAGHTHVVVATIAFGLGINKPDVRFVLHHTLSKSLEAYYQESGRAGRDGLPSDCILYFNPKDVLRMLKLMSGEIRSAQPPFWQMCRYGMQCGGDLLCRTIILCAMGEKTAHDLDSAQQRELEQGISNCDKRDVGLHAQTVTRLLQWKINQGENVAMGALIKDWRAKPENAPPCVADNPPNKDLNPDECDRVIISLLTEGILGFRIQFNAYDAAVYLVLGSKGPGFIASGDPKVVLSLPKRESSGRKSTGATKKARQSVTDDEGWLTKKPAAKKKTRKSSKSTATTKKKAASNTSTSRKRKQPNASKSKSDSCAAKKKAKTSHEVIELDESSDEEKPDSNATGRASLPREARQRVASCIAAQQDDLWDESADGSDEECEFDG